MTKKDQAVRGMLALVGLAGLYGLAGALARYLGHDLGIFEQWYMRYGLACVFAIICFYNKIDLRKLLHLPGREWAVLLFRTIAGSVIAVALLTLAVQQAKIGPVAFMQILPTTALFGVLLFHEKLSWKKGGLLLLSFCGASIVTVSGFNDLSGINMGEVWSLISGAIFSLVLVTRKWHGPSLNNYELTVIMTGMSAIMDYSLSLVLYHRPFIPSEVFTLDFSLVMLLAGAMSVGIHFLMNYGFEHVSSIVASAILDLEMVFGAIFGFVLYGEVLSPREVIGGAVILGAVVLMNQLARSEGEGGEVAPDPIPD